MRCTRCTGMTRPFDDGDICILCGATYFPPIIEVMPEPGKNYKDEETRGKRLIGPSPVLEFYTTIKDLRAIGTKWEAIQDVLLNLGHDLSINYITKKFAAISRAKAMR